MHGVFNEEDLTQRTQRRRGRGDEEFFMKIKMLKTLLLSIMLTALFCSCSVDFWHPGDTVNTSPASKLASHLKTLPDNTASSPYNITLIVKSVKEFDLIRTALQGAPNKYVKLDLTGSTIKTIPESDFNSGGHIKSCITLTGIIIPSSVTSIEGWAFGGCTSLASVTIPDSVTSIGYGAFYGCTSLVSVTIPNGVTSIGYNTFSNCTSLASIAIPDSVTIIEGWSFQDCTSLVSVTIGNGVTSIGYIAFKGCARLASVTIGNGVTSIEGSVFIFFFSLASVTIPSSVTSIGDWAFYGCISLTSVTFNGTILSSWFSSTEAFPEYLRGVFYESDPVNGTPGTYTRTSGSYTWARQ
jgi:hypothetical protein